MYSDAPPENTTQSGAARCVKGGSRCHPNVSSESAPPATTSATQSAMTDAAVRSSDSEGRCPASNVDAGGHRQTAPRILNPRHRALAVERHETRSDVKGGHLRDPSIDADGHLGRPPADVDVEAHAAIQGLRRRSGTVCGEGRLEPVAGAHSHEPPRLLGEDFPYGPGVAPFERHACEDESARVNVLPPQPGGLVLGVNETAQDFSIDGGVRRVRRQQYLRLPENLAAHHNIAGVGALQFQARER